MTDSRRRRTRERVRRRISPVWKWLGVAGLAGVVASGALVARGERVRRAYTPAEVRERLHERARAAGVEPG